MAEWPVNSDKADHADRRNSGDLFHYIGDESRHAASRLAG